jgi:hypothetical protein
MWRQKKEDKQSLREMWDTIKSTDMYDGKTKKREKGIGKND